MNKTLRVLTILLIVTIGSGCSLFKDRIREPLCLPSRPVLEDLTILEQRMMNPDTLEKVAINDVRLKTHIKTIEEITAEHNTQFKAKCAD